MAKIYDRLFAIPADSAGRIWHYISGLGLRHCKKSIVYFCHAPYKNIDEPVSPGVKFMTRFDEIAKVANLELTKRTENINNSN